PRAAARPRRSCRWWRQWWRCSSEVALLLAVFHAGLGDAVVGAGRAAFGDAGPGDLGHHRGVVRGVGLHAAGAGGVADGPEADQFRAGLFAGEGLEESGLGQEHAVALDHLALVRVVDRRQLDVLSLDVLPDVEFGPVRQREDADVLAPAVLAVVELPQLGALRAGVPGAEGVPEGEGALLGAGLLLVATGTAEDRVEAVLLDAAQQGGGLEAVAAGAGAGPLDHAAPAATASRPPPGRAASRRTAS